METAIFSRNGRRRAAGRSWQFTHNHLSLSWLLGLAILFCGSAAQAYTQDSERIDTPWIPDVIAAIDEYVPAPSFNHGYFYLDHFAGPNSADEVGAVTAQMDNGDTVVAGLVPQFGGTALCSNGTSACSIGLVRYNAQGVRVAWTNPGAYGHNVNNYVIYPGGGFGYQYIRDIKIKNGEIYVMVDAGYNAGGANDVQIVAFDSDGSPLIQGLRVVFGYANGSGDSEDFYGAQMAIISDDYMIVTATTYDSVGPYISANRLHIEPNHSLTQDPTWGSGYGGGTVNRLIRYYAPDGLCITSPCAATASYAVNTVAGTLTDDFYVGGSVNFSGNDWDVVTLKISSQNGELKTEFGGGWVVTRFDAPNSTKKDISGGLYVYLNDVYVGAQVAQKCNDGIGLAKLNGATGGDIAAFGGNGQILFGGQGDDPICYINGGVSLPTAMSATGGRIGIAGYQGYRDIQNHYHVDPMLAVVNAVNGQVLDFDAHPLTRSDGTRYGDAVLYGIYGGPNATSPFIVSGNGRDESAGNSLSYVTGKFIPVSSDRIFADNFGSGDDH